MAWKFFTKDGAEKRVPASVTNPSVRLTRSTSQVLASGGFVSFDAAAWDTDSMSNIGSTPTRITFQHAGKYHVGYAVEFPASVTGEYREVEIRKNGTTMILDHLSAETKTTGYCRVVGATIIDVSIGDYIELQVAHDLGGASTFPGNSAYAPTFYANKIDGAVVSYVGVPGSLVGQELAYNEWNSGTVNVTATSGATANTIVTAGAVTLDGSTPIWVEFYTPEANKGAVTYIAFVLYEDGVYKSHLGFNEVQDQAFMAKHRFTPAAGSHTYSIRAFMSAAGTGAVLGGNGTGGNLAPTYIRITRAA